MSTPLTDPGAGVTPPARGLRAAAASALALALGLFAFVGAMAVTGAVWPSAAIALIVVAATGWLVWRYPLLPLTDSACSPALKILAGVATTAALVQCLRLTVFMLDPTQTAYAMGPSRGLGLAIGHSCMTSYYVAAEAIDRTPNVYDDALYSLPGPATERRQPKKLGPFNIDVYEYPPPFLLLPRAMAVAAPEFSRSRLLWFALDGTVLLLALIAVARFLGPIAGTRALLLAPLVLASDLTIGTLQMGNVQPLVMALTVLAMLFFAQRRYAAGAPLLAFVTISKLFPGVLMLYLLMRREWRALAWTTACAAALVAISLADTGWAPYEAFLQHLPGLVGGEAFPAFRNPGAVAKNYSVPGLVFKLGLFGLPGASFPAAKMVGWLYTLIVIGAIAVLARRTLPREQQPIAWLAILTLATLRSPFLPGYAVIPPLWLLTLLAAQAPPTAKTLALTLLAWIALNVLIAQNGPDPRLISAVILIPQIAIAALLALALRGGAPLHESSTRAAGWPGRSDRGPR